MQGERTPWRLHETAARGRGESGEVGRERVQLRLESCEARPLRTLLRFGRAPVVPSCWTLYFRDGHTSFISRWSVASSYTYSDWSD